MTEKRTYDMPVRIYIDRRPYSFKVRINESKMVAEVVTAMEPVGKELAGVGDAVSRVAKAVGIEKKKGCGCAKRQKMLNDMMPVKPDGIVAKTTDKLTKVLGVFGKKK
tara:strand:+ start:150 stop:473 length:324 start_codon:yes stop_codon:yes gene_type:complete